MALVLYAADDFRGAKAAVAAALAGVELRRVTGAEAEAVAKEHAFGKLPLLVTREGVLPRSNAILRYIAQLREDSTLYGSGAFAAAQVDQWLDFSAVEIDPLHAILTHTGIPEDVGDEEVAKATPAATAALKPVLAVLEAHLATRTFLVGERVTLADVAVACTLRDLFATAIGAAERDASLPNLTRWFLTCVHQPAFAGVLGEVTLFSGGGGGSDAAASAPARGGAGGAAGGAGGSGGGAGGGGGAGEAGAASGFGFGADGTMRIPAIPALFSRGRVRLSDLLDRPDKGLAAVGQSVTVAGWSRTTRKQAKDTLVFVSLSDGSCFDCLQVVCNVESTEGFADVFENGTVGSSLRITGNIIASPAKGQEIELQATSATVLGTADAKTYPLSKKFHKLETLREMQHLRPRSVIFGAVTRVRNALAYATHTFFQSRGFLYIHTPLITCSDCEGAGEMFRVTTVLPDDDSVAKLPVTPEGKIDFSGDFFGRQANMTVSGQLQVESFAVSMSDVYTFGPTFRAEDSHTSRHLAEFWMIEPEIAFADLKTNMDLAEDYVKFCTQFCLDHCAADLEFFDQRVEKGLIKRLQAVVAAPFERITYTRAIEILTDPKILKKAKFDEKPFWGIDLGSEHERYLTDVIFNKPVIVTDYPKGIKAFYMKLSEDGKTVRAMDILVPRIGELVGGSQREEKLEVLEARMEEMGVEKEALQWYLDLRRYGSVPHSGFGLGFERLVMYVTGMAHIRDVIPFPRWPGHASV
mmetsp:Transcript_19201/g.67772  ORF Transcript_19201/g.67772 Transcript_19201/m.67772 type:complete len:753 (-) Transcript_19201:131-2389(-)